MTNFNNAPKMSDNSGEHKVKRYVHQQLTVEHYGLHAKIQENGRVLIQSSPVKDSNGDMEYDEVEIPASLVFKLATLLKATRNIEYVTMTEAKDKNLSVVE